MDFRILGPLSAVDNGREIALGGSKQRALLGLLLLHPGETLSTDRLIDELWGEHPPAGAAKAVQVRISRLRKALSGEAGTGSTDLLITREHGYELQLDPERLDAYRFERLLGEGRTELAAGRLGPAVSALERAASLWRGPPLADLAYEPFAQPEVARLADLRVAGLEQLIEAKLALGRHAEVVEELETLISEHPYREGLRAQLMLALYRCDRQAEALQAYQNARTKLVEELGIEPGERMRELERQILAQDPSLAVPVPETIDLGAEPGAERPAELEISLIGPPRVLREGRPVSFDTRKATALLAHLTLTERPRSREALCGLLWPGRDPEHARGALRRTLSALRKAVGEEWIDAVADSVALRAGDGLVVDVRRFRSLATEDAPPEDLAAAVKLFRGGLLEGFSLRDSPEFDAWYVEEADALQRELGSALARLVRLLRERGDLARAIPHARRWLELDPLHEPAHRELIRLYAMNGDRAAALGQYRECVRTLSQELGVAPVEETAALFEQVSEGTLAPLAPEVRTAPAVGPSAPAELPLVGRAHELGALVGAWRAAAPDGRLAVIEGEAGIGKTRLAHELTANVAADGGAVLAAGCHEDEAGIPYGPVVALLGEALREAPEALAERVSPQRLADAALLLPELASLGGDLPPPIALSGPGARARLLEAVAEVLAAACHGSTPGLVLVDDVHAADEATLETLAYLCRRPRGRALLLAVGWRSEGVPPGHRLRRLATELTRLGAATIVRLERLDEAEVGELVRTVQPSGAPDLERRVYVESEGLPLFVAEYLAALDAGVEPAEEPLPREMRGLLQARLGGLGAMGRQLLETAAVIGRSFEVDTVRAASGRSDEEAVQGLDELVARGLVREASGPEPAYDFTHGKLRALVYEEVGLARRRLLHRRVADALSRATPGAEGAALVAQHLRLGGDQSGAAEQHRRAGEHAASLLAHAGALDHLEAALALGHADAAGLHERIGDLSTLVGDYARALANYESAAAQGESGSVPRIEHKLGGVHVRRGEWDRAEARFAVALGALAPDQDGLRARILADLSLTLHHAGRPDEAAAMADEARTLAGAAGDRLARAQAHNLLGVLASGDGRLDVARTELERSLSLAEKLDDVSARVAALNNLALVAHQAGERDRALELTGEALALCAAQGDRHREAALENNLADLHHAAGHDTESMEHLKRAVAIFSEVGADESTRLPEIWKLVSW
jgi:DNA-binding SARP family transcriptional activator